MKNTTPRLSWRLWSGPELSHYMLYSVTPRVLKADPRGLHWQVLWQERAFPHRRWLVVRVYVRDGYAATERER
jgi:hypothetical protein